MQIKLFNIPISDNGTSLEEMNRFLRGHKVLETEQRFYQNERGACWCFCVKYLDTIPYNTGIKREKIDYKNVLNEKDFKTFSILRECRKEIAQNESIPAYAVFTDEELSGISKLPEITVSKLKTIKGIGEKKAERFGERIIKLYCQKQNNEKDRQSDSKNS